VQKNTACIQSRQQLRVHIKESKVHDTPVTDD